MKRITSIFSLVGASAMVVLLASCGSVGHNDFTRAKYYDFGRNDKDVALAKIKSKESKQETVTKPVTTISKSADNEKQPAVSIAQPVNAKSSAQQIVKKASNLQHKSVISASALPEVKKSSSIDKIAAATPENIQDTKSTEGGGSSVPEIVLIILAILIPPLAVYLHDMHLSTPFWVILILWLIGIYGFAFPLAFLSWLVAVIWAIIIVTA